MAAWRGGQSREIDAYNSNGLGLIGPEAAAKEAAELAKGFGAVEIRWDLDADGTLDLVTTELPVAS